MAAPFRRFATLLSGCFLLALAAWILNRAPQHFYPSLEIAAAPNLKLAFVLSPQSNLASCESMLGRISRATLGQCPTCRVTQLKCDGKLTPEQEQLASTGAAAFPTAGFSEGIIAYRGTDTALASATCKTTQDVNPLVTCHPPGVERPALRLMPGALLLAKAGWGLVVAMTAATGLGLLSLAALNRPLPSAGQIFYGALNALDTRSRLAKQFLIVFTDVLSLLFALWLAYCIRYESWHIPDTRSAWLFAIVPLIGIPAFATQGLYHAVVRFLGMQAVWAVVKAVALYTALIYTVTRLANPGAVPLSVVALNGILALALVALTRLTARDWFHRYYLRANPNTPKKNVLIYGAGAAGVQLCAALAQSREMQPVAFVDDDPRQQGRRIAGLSIHSPADIERLISALKIAEVLIAIPSASRSRRSEILSTIEALPVRVQMLPGLADLAQGKITVSDLREVQIEDLLGRNHVEPDAKLLRQNIAGKVVLITGAGGSIGSELCRQISRLDAKALILLESSELALYSIERELAGSPHPSLPVTALLGSVVDSNRVRQILRTYQVQTVFHAAAYKHVPLVEANPIQGAANNILGTWHTALTALEEHVESFVLISTDKAVRPTNVMGATKRMAEMILQALNEQYPGRTCFTMVRFGNVLGSSGSVVPLFREQIKRGGPVTVTDPRIIRYFMTIPEAAQLVIQAGAMGLGGDVFVLDMGEPVKILDLAKRMISLAGLSEKDANRPNGDIEIVYTGLRPGEKLYEELLIGSDARRTSHPKILRALEPTLSWNRLHDIVSKLETACSNEDSDTLRKLLTESVSDFRPRCDDQNHTKESVSFPVNVTR